MGFPLPGFVLLGVWVWRPPYYLWSCHVVEVRKKKCRLAGLLKLSQHMKNPIENLNKVFDSRIRLGIMSALLVNAEVNFNELKELIAATDGNLSSHLKTLEENGFLKVQKGFIG